MTGYLVYYLMPGDDYRPPSFRVIAFYIGENAEQEAKKKVSISSNYHYYKKVTIEEK